MANRLFVATRKGLFTLERNNRKQWSIANASFLSDNCTIVLPDPRDGGKTIFAALNHGHFGVKMHRSLDGGSTWTETPAPTYPKQPEGAEPEVNPMSGQPIPWTLKLVWGLEPRLARDPEGLEDMTEEAVQLAVKLGLTKPGARILILAGTPFGAPGAANLLRFAHAPVR